MYNELKPCPFCGGEAELYQSYCGYYQIECHQCSARSCTAVEKESVISNWNKRSTTEIKSKTMTLDEAIEYCEEVTIKNCLEYVEEHQQLASGLYTLKYLEENAVMPIYKKQDWLDVANYYGIKQIPVAIEEMAELTQVLTKYLRISQGGQPALKLMSEVQDSVEEELSDVIVMMIQLQYLFNIDNGTINKIADEKLKRTLKLMEEQK